jgi:transglutaminase-like putative cysteine protease
MTSPRSPRLSLSPVEGWLTVAMVAAMALCLAWSLNSAAWVLGRPVLTSFLPYASLGGVAWGFISAKAGWPRWLALLLGAVFAGLLLPIMVGGILLKGDFTPGPAFVATANSTVEAYLDLAFRGLAFTEQYGHFMLVLGILCWGTGQFASYAVFGHHRPFSAVVISGVALVINMSITRDEQQAILVWFSVAALILLIRAHALDERSTWLRHRLGDAGSLSGIYLRAGSAFIAIAVAGALVLTSTASSAPLNGIGNGLDEQIADATQWVQSVFRGGGAGPRLITVGFGDSEKISGSWTTNNKPILQIAVPNGETGDYHWRAVTYNSFDGFGWSNTAATRIAVAAAGPLLAGTLDDPGPNADRRNVLFTVHALADNPQNIFAPDAPTSVTTDTTVTMVGAQPNASIGSIKKQTSSDYTVTAEVPIDYAVDKAHGLTANQLRVAGDVYPATVSQDYTAIPPDVRYAPATNELLRKIVASMPAGVHDEYDISKAIEDYLRSPLNFSYNANVTSLGCTDGVVECFAQTRQGYCEYYASTMVALLRILGYPARLAEGYLPSKVDLNGFETIPASAAHAWVEVYFPHYGWITFDPTGGSVGDPVSLEPGPVVKPLPSATPAPSIKAAAGSNDAQQIHKGVDQTGSLDTPGSDSGSGGFVLVGLLLITLMAALVLLAWQRGPRTAQEPDRVYGGVVGLARRLGFGPRPNQTVYEYAGDLGNILPAARPDLQTVARAKVEVAYGRQTLSPARIDALARAQRHLRVVLLGLIFRRAERRAQRRRR